MIQVHFPIIGMTCSTVRLPNAIMFQYKFTRFHLVLNQDLQDFQDCRERLRFRAMVIRRRLLFTLLFAAAYASARGLALKVPYNNNLPTHTNDVMVNHENPVNPDSKTTRCCAHNFQQRLGDFLVFRECFP